MSGAPPYIKDSDEPAYEVSWRALVPFFLGCGVILMALMAFGIFLGRGC